MTYISLCKNIYRLTVSYGVWQQTHHVHQTHHGLGTKWDGPKRMELPPQIPEGVTLHRKSTGPPWHFRYTGGNSAPFR